MTAPQKVRREDLVDRHGAAKILGVHPNTVDRLGLDGDLTRYRVKGVRGVLYLRTEIEDCIQPIPPGVKL